MDVNKHSRKEGETYAIIMLANRYSEEVEKKNFILVSVCRNVLVISNASVKYKWMHAACPIAQRVSVTRHFSLGATTSIQSKVFRIAITAFA